MNICYVIMWNNFDSADGDDQNERTDSVFTDKEKAEAYCVAKNKEEVDRYAQADEHTRNYTSFFGKYVVEELPLNPIFILTPAF